MPQFTLEEFLLQLDRNQRDILEAIRIRLEQLASAATGPVTEAMVREAVQGVLTGVVNENRSLLLEASVQAWNQSLRAAQQALPNATLTQQLTRLIALLQRDTNALAAGEIVAAHETAMRSLIDELSAAGLRLTEEGAEALASRLERIDANDQAALAAALSEAGMRDVSASALSNAATWIRRFAPATIIVEVVPPQGAAMGGPRNGSYVVYHGTDNASAASLRTSGIQGSPPEFHVSTNPASAASFGQGRVGDVGGTLELVRYSIPEELFLDLYSQGHIRQGPTTNSLIITPTGQAAINQASGH